MGLPENIAHALYVSVTSLRMAVIFVSSRILICPQNMHTTETGGPTPFLPMEKWGWTPPPQ